MFGVNGAGITNIYGRIFDRNNSTIITYNTNVSEDGFIPLWDGGNKPTYAYYYEMAITTYEGNTRIFNGVVNLIR
jgi:hypothetical protein